MNSERLRHDLFVLAGYLLTSAYGLYSEPASYGPRRLMDAARGLLSAQEAAGLSDPFLEELRQALDGHRFGNSDDSALRQFLDDACLQYAAELKKRIASE
jgi:hypothetical protein